MHERVLVFGGGGGKPITQLIALFSDLSKTKNCHLLTYHGNETDDLRKQFIYKQSTRGPGNKDKVPCPRALLLLLANSNWGPHGSESGVLSTEQEQLL